MEAKQNDYLDNEDQLNSLLDEAIHGLSERNSFSRSINNKLINSSSTNSIEKFTSKPNNSNYNYRGYDMKQRELQTKYDYNSNNKIINNYAGNYNDSNTNETKQTNIKNENKDSIDKKKLDYIDCELGVNFNTFSNFIYAKDDKNEVKNSELEDRYDLYLNNSNNIRTYSNYNKLNNKRKLSDKLLSSDSFKHNLQKIDYKNTYDNNINLNNTEDELIERLNQRINSKKKISLNNQNIQSKDENFSTINNNKTNTITLDSTSNLYQEPKSSALKTILGEINTTNRIRDSSCEISSNSIDKVKFKNNNNISNSNSKEKFTDIISNVKAVGFSDVKSELLNLQSKLSNLERKLGKLYINFKLK